MLVEISSDKYQDITATLVQKIGASAAVEPVNTSITHRYFIYQNANGEPQAAAVLYFPTVKYQGEKCCYFGNFICIKDANTFNNFFVELEKIAIATEAKHFIGPMNGSTWNGYRWSLSSAGELFTGDVTNPDFYPTYLQNTGFKVIAAYQTSRDSQLAYDAEAAARKSARLSNVDWNIRTLDSSRMKEELSRIYSLSVTAFAENFLYSPISESDFIAKYSAWLQVIPADMILLAEDAKGDLLGFLLSYPCSSDGLKKGVVIKTLARRPEDAYRGIGLMLCRELYDSLQATEYDYVLHALMQQTNHSIKTSTVLSGNLVREYALFGKNLVSDYTSEKSKV